jgi:hypothetical protein
MSELELRLHHDLLRLRWQGKGPWIERWVNGTLEDARDGLREALKQILKDQTWWNKLFNRPVMLVVLEPDAQSNAIKSIWLQALERQPVKQSLVMLSKDFEEYISLSPEERKLERVADD